MTKNFIDPFVLQGRLFTELSALFAKEVPLYDRSLAVNQQCNRVVCELIAKLHQGFEIDHAQMAKTNGERHGAIRIGRPDEYRWIGKFFRAFGMQPHNFYDMTDLGEKSQPVIATAFRSAVRPEHRMFTSLLMTSYFDNATQQRIEALLAQRQVFSQRAKDLVEKSQRQGGLDEQDGDALIREGVERIFKWTGQAHDYQLYRDLCEAGFKIAADIACFESHHLNHLTPNTLCIDLYTAVMRYKMGELDPAHFRRRVQLTLTRLTHEADSDWLRLHFMNLTVAQIDRFKRVALSQADIAHSVDDLLGALDQSFFDFSQLEHEGFKDFTEGPSYDTPVLLRQDAYKALTEPVRFVAPDGLAFDAGHPARFGEIEQRFYATTRAGRCLYDECLARADRARDENQAILSDDFETYEARCAAPFKPFPKTLHALLEQGLVYGKYSATTRGLAAGSAVRETDIHALVRQGFAQVEGLRYEDFLPVSAAGIFASNLDQDGTRSTAAIKPHYTQALLEEILDQPIVDSDVVYQATQSASILDTFTQLGVIDQLPAWQIDQLAKSVAACPVGCMDEMTHDVANA